LNDLYKIVYFKTKIEKLNIVMDNQANSLENISCKNCQTEFQGNYCPQCGQSIKDYDRPFGLIIYDLMGNIFAFDTRLWRTFIAVLFQPGKMAKEFIMGHRVKYMPPFRFYIFVSFIFFLILNYLTLSNIGGHQEGIVFNEKGNAVKDSVINQMAMIGDSLLADSVMKEKYSYYNKSIDYIDKKVDKEKDEKVKDLLKHPQYYIPQVIKYLSWMLFFLMPIYGMLLWLFFNKKYKYYLGHLIFAINQHSFLFIVFIMLMGIYYIFPNKETAYEAWLLLLIPVYALIGARRLYQRRWVSVVFRLLTVLFIYHILLISALITAVVVPFI
jgi:hypothetical protein